MIFEWKGCGSGTASADLGEGGGGDANLSPKYDK